MFWVLFALATSSCVDIYNYAATARPYTNPSTLTLTNCLFRRLNHFSGRAGVLFTEANSKITITNCVFYMISSNEVGAISMYTWASSVPSMSMQGVSASYITSPTCGQFGWIHLPSGYNRPNYYKSCSFAHCGNHPYNGCENVYIAYGEQIIENVNCTFNKVQFSSALRSWKPDSYTAKWLQINNNVADSCCFVFNNFDTISNSLRYAVFHSNTSPSSSGIIAISEGKHYMYDSNFYNNSDLLFSLGSNGQIVFSSTTLCHLQSNISNKMNMISGQILYCSPTAMRTKEITPMKTLEKTQNPTKEMTPEQTHENTPCDTMEMTPEQTHENTPYDTMEMTPEQTHENTPCDTMVMTPEQTHENTPYDTVEMTPVQTLYNTENPTLEITLLVSPFPSISRSISEQIISQTQYTYNEESNQESSKLTESSQFTSNEKPSESSNHGNSYSIYIYSAVGLFSILVLIVVCRKSDDNDESSNTPIIHYGRKGFTF